MRSVKVCPFFSVVRPEELMAADGNWRAASLLIPSLPITTLVDIVHVGARAGSRLLRWHAPLLTGCPQVVGQPPCQFQRQHLRLLLGGHDNNAMAAGESTKASLAEHRCGEHRFSRPRSQNGWASRGSGRVSPKRPALHRSPPTADPSSWVPRAWTEVRPGGAWGVER